MGNSKGFSLIETMIAAATLGVAALLLLGHNNLYVSQGYNIRRACQSHAEAIIGAVQEETYYRAIQNTIPVVSPRTAPPNTDFTASRAIPAANLNWYWRVNGVPNPTYNVSDAGIPGTEPLMHNNFLIQGSLRSLAAIYNNVPAVRCAYAAYAPLTSLPFSGTLADAAPVVTMQLSPLLASTGASLCGAVPATVYPSARSRNAGNLNLDPFALGSGTMTSAFDSKDLIPTGTGTDSATLIYPIVAPNSPNDALVRRALGGVSPDTGIMMAVQVNYNYKGVAGSCVASQKFEYPVDRTAPPAPNRIEVTANNSIAGGAAVLRDYCGGSNGPVASSAGAATIQVGYAGLNTEGGTQFMCLDMSWIRVPDPAQTSMVQCQNPGGIPITGAWVPVMNTPNQAYFSTNFFPYPYTPNFALRSQRWQPCDLLIQCGRAPATTAATSLVNPNLYLTNTYTGLPAGCVLNFEVVAIDTAGNRSGNRSVSASRAFLEEPNGEATTSAIGGGYPEFQAFDDEIYYPQCAGAPNPATYQGGLGNNCTGGYYRCNGGC